MGFTQVTLTGTIEESPGVPRTDATITATLSGEMSDGVAVITPSAVSTQVASDGTFSLTVAANDTPSTTPTGRYYNFIVTANQGATVDQFSAVVPQASAPSVPLYSLPRLGPSPSVSLAYGVSSFNTRTGVVVLSKADVTSTGLTAGDVGAVPTDPAHAHIGAPSTGVHVAGEVYVDANGAIWACSAGGTPGTWFAAGSGVELAEAELTADTSLTQTVATDLVGLSLTFTAPARAFMLELNVPFMSSGAAAQYCELLIMDSANTLIVAGFAVPWATSGVVGPVKLSGRLPRTGGYAIIPGNSYTFKVRYLMSAVTGGNGSISVTLGGRPTFRAVTC